MKRVKIFSVFLAFFVVFTTFASFNNTAIAETTEEKPDRIEFKIIPNEAKSSNHIVAKDGTDCYKVGDILAFDVYLMTKNASVNHFYVDLGITPVMENYVKLLPDRTEKIADNRFTMVNMASGDVWIYFNREKKNDVILKNNNEMKLATFYCRVDQASIGNSNADEGKFEVWPGVEELGRFIADTKYTTKVQDQINRYSFYVTDIPEKINLANSSVNMLVDQETEIETTVVTTKTIDSNYAKSVFQEVTYTSDHPNVAKVLSNGKIYGASAGTATITIASKVKPEIKTTVTVNVADNSGAKPIQSLTWDNPPTSMSVGEEKQLNVQITPNDATNQSLYYSSSNPKVITISNDGKIEAVGEGTATITVQSNNGKEAICTINTNNLISKVEILNPIDSLSMQAQSTYPIRYRVFNQAGEIDDTLEDLVKIKCSDTKNIRVNPDKSITNTGAIVTVKVTAYVGNIEDSFWVAYIPDPKESDSFRIINKKAKMALRDTFQIKTKVEPDTASAKLVKFYTSDPRIATVDKNGKLTPIKPGTVTVTAFQGGRTDTFEIEISENVISLEDISLSQTNIAKKMEEEKELTFSYVPVTPTDDVTLKWESTNQDIASVDIDDNAKVIKIKKGYKPGKATINIMNGDINKTIQVTSYGIGLEDSFVFVDRESEYQLEPIILLPNENEKYTITYQSDNPDKISVDENGLVRTGYIQNGENVFANITITLTTESGETYTTKAGIRTVIRVHRITIKKDGTEAVSGQVIEMEVGDEISLTAFCEPTDADNAYYYTWKYSDDTVVSRDRDFIRANKIGRTTITVASNENPDITDTCTIVVVDQLHGNTKTVPAEESTCIKHGHNEYVICEDCGKIMSGSDAELPLVSHKGGTATCNKKAICEVCGQGYGFFDINNHETTELRNVVKATEEQEGYTGDTFCVDCNKLLEKGEAIPVLPKKTETKPQEPIQKEEEPVIEKQDEPIQGEKDSAVPKTGDNFNGTIWTMLLVTSFIGIVGLGYNLKLGKDRERK